ncbi:MAG: ribbon-helix-helix protein, CopG family [Thermoleophilia bacterium]|nr:ribbon-helix-helix protein, CopG family [Thermoleophilia bacterium]
MNSMKQERHVSTTVSVPLSTFVRVQELADKRQRPLSQIVAEALAAYLAKAAADDVAEALTLYLAKERADDREY